MDNRDYKAMNEQSTPIAPNKDIEERAREYVKEHDMCYVIPRGDGTFYNAHDELVVHLQEFAQKEADRDSRWVSVETELAEFGNFIRDNYYGIGTPKMISYDPSKYPHATIEEIVTIWKEHHFRNKKPKTNE